MIKLHLEKNLLFGSVSLSASGDDDDELRVDW